MQKKRLISWVLALALCLSSTPFAYAEGVDETGGTTDEALTVAKVFLDIEGQTHLDAPATATITDKGSTIDLYASIAYENGAIDYATDAGVRILWTSSDENVATIDTLGTVTALNDGTTVIRATEEESGCYAEITLSVYNQNDVPYITSIDLVDASGNSIGDAPINITENYGEYQFYTRVVWSDGTEETGRDISNVLWTSSSPTFAPVGDTGTCMSKGTDGNYEITATISGGLAGAFLADSAYVIVNTGQADDMADKGDLSPSDTFTVEVRYENLPDVVAESTTYTKSELEALGTTQSFYTYITGAQTYRTYLASGVYLSTILQAQGLELNEISYFVTESNVGGNNTATISYGYLYGSAHYYYPLNPFTQSSFRQNVFPMIATAVAAASNDVDVDADTLDGAYCFQLLMGSTTSNDTKATQRSTYNMHTLVVYMQGSPPAESDDNDPQDDQDDDKPKNEGAAVSDGGGGGTALSGGASNETDGTAASDLAENSIGSGEEADGSETADSSSDDDASSIGSGSGSEFHVYEMLSNATSDIDEVDYNNPLEPYVLPLALLLVMTGGLMTNWQFRKELS